MENQKNNITYISETSYMPKINIIKAVVFSAVGFGIFAMCLFSAKTIKTSGTEISLIESVGGKTLEEAYYHSLGMIYFALGNVVTAIGIFFCAVLIWCGLRKE